jgi:hypothetical protein
MKIQSILILLLLILLNSCGNQRQIYLEKKTSIGNEKIQYTISPYVIKDAILDSIEYNNYSVYQDSSGVSFIFLLNEATANFEIYNLEEKSLVLKKPYLNLIGAPDEYGEINSIYFHNFDSIFIAQHFLISLIDTSQIIFSKIINDPESDLNPEAFYLNQGEFPIFYDSEAKGLLIQTYCSACKFYENNYFESPIESIIKFDSKSILKFPTQYSRKYLEGYYGFANQVHRTTYNEFSYYSFPIDPNIYEFNRKNNTLNILGGRSNFQITEPNTLERKYKDDSNRKFRHMYQVPFYHQVIFDPYRNYFYRFFSKSLPLKNEDGTYNSWGDKELILMVFNSKFELLEEVKLGKHKYSTTKSFVTKDGLFISNSHYKNSNYDKKSIRFNLFKFSK